MHAFRAYFGAWLIVILSPRIIVSVGGGGVIRTNSSPLFLLPPEVPAVRPPPPSDSEGGAGGDLPGCRVIPDPGLLGLHGDVVRHVDHVGQGDGVRHCRLCRSNSLCANVVVDRGRRWWGVHCVREEVTFHDCVSDHNGGRNWYRCRRGWRRRASLSFPPWRPLPTLLAQFQFEFRKSKQKLGRFGAFELLVACGVGRRRRDRRPFIRGYDWSNVVHYIQR